jgi:hypothetical protein
MPRGHITSALDGSEWLASCPHLFYPRKWSGFPLNRSLGGTQSQSGRFRKEKNLWLQPDSIPGPSIVQKQITHHRCNSGRPSSLWFWNADNRYPHAKGYGALKISVINHQNDDLRTTSKRDFRFSQQCGWGFRYFRTCCNVFGWIFSDVSREQNALFSEDKQSTSYSADNTGCHHRAHELRTALVRKSDKRS